jgi:lysophospholipase L1-like esterase
MKIPGYLPALLASACLACEAGCAATTTTASTTSATRPATNVAAAKPDPMPVFTAGTRILFQGDSITDGNRGRTADPNHILGHGYQAEVAARFGADLAERNLVFLNRGVSANTVPRLAARWQADTIDLKPDILSILIGVNDLDPRLGTTADIFEKNYDQLLADTLKALPNVKLVLGEPFGLPVGAKKAIWETYTVDLATRRAIVAKLALKYHAAFVLYQKMFDEATKRMPADYWIWDGIHPTYSGHQLMADEWVRTVQAYWPAGK